MRARLFAFSCAAAALLAARSELTQVSGDVTDNEGAVIADAEVRLISTEPPFEVSRTRTNRNGSFRIEEVRPGVYTVRAGNKGFREEVRRNVTVRPDRTNRIDLRLGVMTCDTPLMHCDTIEDILFDDHPPNPPPLPYFRRGEVVLNRNCGIDLDNGEIACSTDPVASALDLLLVQRADSGLELKPGDRASLSAGRLLGEHCSKQKFRKAPYLITGLGPGTELCALTKKRHRALIYVEDEVSNGSSSVKLYYATYK